MIPDTTPPDPDVIRANRGDGPLGQRVLIFRETASTNDLALRLGESGEPEGTLIVAESQTAGRGRFQRPWHSAPGLGLWMSILLRQTPAAGLTALTPFTAICLAETICAFASCPVRIKAPNDIHASRGKLAGILIEARSGPRPFAVLGIGINVNQSVFPSELEAIATSLALETGRLHDRTALLCAVLQNLNRRLPELATPSPSFLNAYITAIG